MRRLGWQGLGALALAASLIGGLVDPRMFFAAWLSAWWFCVGLMFGSAANTWMHRLTGGAWGVVLRPVALALMRPLPGLLLLFVPLLFGLRLIYPWADAGSGWTATMTRPGFAEAWFAPLFSGARLVAYGFVLVWLARPARAERSGAAAAALIVYMLVASLAAVDLLMSLQPAWVSTVFGWLATIGQMLGGAAAAIALAAARASTGGPAGVSSMPATSSGPKPPPVWRDLGNLLLMYLMVQAYLQFMQFLIIWAENLPREIAWFVPRLQTGWAAVGLALVLLQFALPFFALLWRRVKDDPRRLARVAAGIVVMQAVGTAWLVVPSVDAHSWNGWWLLPLTHAGMALLLFGAVPAALRETDQATGQAIDQAGGPARDQAIDRTSGRAGGQPGEAHA